MIHNELAEERTDPSVYCRLKAMLHAVERPLEVDPEKYRFTDLDKDQLQSLAQFLRDSIQQEQKQTDDSVDTLLFRAQSFQERLSTPEVIQTLRQVDSLKTWRKKSAYDKKIGILAHTIEAFVKSASDKNCIFAVQDIPREPFKILGDMVDAILRSLGPLAEA